MEKCQIKNIFKARCTFLILKIVIRVYVMQMCIICVQVCVHMEMRMVGVIPQDCCPPPLRQGLSLAWSSPLDKGKAFWPVSLMNPPVSTSVTLRSKNSPPCMAFEVIAPCLWGMHLTIELPAQPLMFLLISHKLHFLFLFFFFAVGTRILLCSWGWSQLWDVPASIPWEMKLLGVSKIY